VSSAGKFGSWEGTILFLVMLALPNLHQAGHAVALFAAGSMVAAALVLIISSPKLARAAAIQGIAPLLGIVFLTIGLAV